MESPSGRPQAQQTAAGTMPAADAGVAPPGGGRTLGGSMRGTPGRVIGSVMVLVALVAGVVYAGDFFGIRDRLQPIPKAPTPVAHGPTSDGGPPALASNGYWQTVTTLEGSGSDTPPAVSISAGALQWRVSWTCATGGRLAVRTGGGSPALIDAGCPGSGVAYGVKAGTTAFTVTAAGPWHLTVEQQIDTPLIQPPLPAMTAPGAAAVSTASFYGIDQTGSGEATVYRLADHSYALRLTDFYVTPNSSLDIRFSSVASPHNDDDVSNSQVASVAELVATAGSMNFAVPSGVDPTKYGSLVVWCVQLHTAYSAAHLVPAH